MILVNNMPYIAVEINEIFKVLSPNLLEKIPTNIIIFFKETASNEYVFKYDVSKDLSSQNIRQDTKEMIAIIYRDYICNENERKEFIELRKNIEYKKDQEKRKKYNVDNIFNTSSVQNQNLVIENTKTSIFTKIINFIKNIFK